MQVHSFRRDRHLEETLPDVPKTSREKTLVIVFGASEIMDNQALLTPILDAYSWATIVGCSTAGEIYGQQIFDHSLSVAIAQFAHTTVRVETIAVPNSTASQAVGGELAKNLMSNTLRGVFVLSDGLHVNGSELVRGMNAEVSPSVAVTGGLAGDGDRFKRTWVLKDGRPQTGYITAVGFYGDKIEIGHGSKGGWDLFGPERVVTRARGNVLYELDGKPALALYKEYLGERASGLPATGLLFPLALRAHRSDHRQLVRTILAVDEETQSMTFAGDLPEGHLAQLMRANFDRLIQGASDAALATKSSQHGSTPVLSIAISCVGRRLVLGQRAEEEVEATLEGLPPKSHQVGFYSYGELSPYANGTCELHNQTMTLTTIREP